MRRLLTIALILGAAAAVHRTHAQQLWGTTLRGGPDKGGTIYKINADNSSFVEVVHEFTVDVKAQSPIGPLTLATNNKFYGVTRRGGATDQGTIFEFDPVTQTYTTRWEFTAPDIMPGGGLLLASNGKLYGVCTVGGTSGRGVIYSFDISSGAFTRVFSFANMTAHGASPTGELIEGAPGKLNGINTDGGGPGSSGIGILYEFDFNTLALTKLYTFTNAGGTRPTAGVTMDASGVLYGITISNGASNRGTFYSFNKATSTYTRIHEFKNNDGAQPLSTPLTHSNGKIYGMATGSLLPNEFGNDDGVIYEYDPAPGGTGFTIKDRFGDGSNDIGSASPGGLREAANGNLYALAVSDHSTIIEYDPSLGVTTAKIIDLPVRMGVRPDNSFALGPGGDLYTAYVEGGATGRGTIVRYSPVSNTATMVLDFGSSGEGAYPYGDLVKASNGKLYGMLSVGGEHGLGIIFEIDPVTGVFTKKYDFDGLNGGTPLGGMILSANGKLYGTTTFGGPSSDERSYQDNQTGVLSGARGHGALFEYDPATNTYLKKLDFTTTTGTNPYGKLTEASNGKLYGVTSMDGASGGGTLYEYVIDGAITIRHDFAAGASPKCQLAELDGKLYGTTPFLGDNNGGTIFEFEITSNTFTTKASFSAPTNTSAAALGSNPHGGPAVHNGKLYGVTSTGGLNAASSGHGGTLYEYTPGATTVVKKLDLPADAKGPVSTLVAQEGKLYGTFTWSTNMNGGTFVYDPATNVFTKKFEFTGDNGAYPQWGALLVVGSKLGQFIAFAEQETQQFAVTPVSAPFISVPTTSSVGLPVTYTSSNPAVAHVDVAGRITQVGVGTTIITATQAGNGTYEAVEVQRTVIIIKGSQTITWSPPPVLLTPKLSQGTVTLLAASSSGLPITYASGNTAIATVSGNILTLKKAGNVTITATQPGNSNYNAAANISTPFAIQRGDQSITFPDLAAREVSDVSFELAATATSQLPVTYESSEPAVATVSGSTVTIITPGTTSITATQEGNSDWNAAPQVSRILLVIKMSQTITFGVLEARTLGASPFTVSATASSGLPVAFGSTSTGRITISGNTVTMLRAGVASITASQTGNTSYNAAPAVTRSFCINPAKPVVNTVTNNSGNLMLTTLLAGNLQWHMNGEPVASATQPTYIAEVPGAYTVVVDVEGCLSAPSDAINVVITDVAPVENFTFSFYPNPVTDKLHIAIPGNQGSRVSIVGMDGRIMDERDTLDEEIVIIVRDYPEGMYMVRSAGIVRRFMKK